MRFSCSIDQLLRKPQIRERGQRVKPRVKIIVIACNTATAYGLKDIASLLEQSKTGVKVIGVINAGVKATLDELNVSEGDQPFAIGVLATPGTIASGAYQRTIEEMVAERGIKTNVTVVNQKGYGFAEAVDSEPDFVNPALIFPRDSYRGPRIGQGDESIDINLMRIYNFDFAGYRMLYKRDAQGSYKEIQLNDAVNYARFNLVSLVEKHRLSGSTAPLRAVILGCTHYPFLIETLWQVIDELKNVKVEGQYLYKHLIADDFLFIDPAVYTAIECYMTLREEGNLALRIGEQRVNGYISVPDGFLDGKYLHFDEKTHLRNSNMEGMWIPQIIATKQVPFSKSNIDSNNLPAYQVTVALFLRTHLSHTLLMLNEHITPEEIECLEIISFPGEINVISTTGKKFSEAIKHLREQIFIGFDTETKPNFNANTPRHKTALLQLASETKAFLFRVNKIGLPQELADLLSNPEITKVGAATTDDIRGLRCYREFEPRRFIDLQDFVEQYGILEKSVRKLAAIILGKRISKAQQLSNWEAAKLTPAQQLYAATDAWICVKMYKKLLASPKVPLQENEV